MSFRTRRASMLCLAAAALLGLSACESGDDTNGDSASMGVINTHCPGMPQNTVNDSVAPIEYKGHKIGLCCGGCEGHWDDMSEAEKDAFVAKALEGASMGAVGESKGDCSGGACCETEKAGTTSPGAVGEKTEGCCPGKE